MQYDRTEMLVFLGWGRLPRPPAAPRRPRRRWRWRWRAAPQPPAPVAPPAAQEPSPLQIHEYLELEFAVGEERRR